MSAAYEQGLVQQLIAHAAVERLCISLLHQLAGCDVAPVDPGLAAPRQNRIAGQLSTIIADDHAQLAPVPDQLGKLPNHPAARDRGVGHGSQALARHVIDDVEHPELAPGCHLVVHEDQAPALVGQRCSRRSRAGAHRAPARLRFRTVSPSSEEDQGVTSGGGQADAGRLPASAISQRRTFDQ